MGTKHTPGPWNAAWGGSRLWAGVNCGDEQDPHRAEVCTVCVENIELDDDSAWERAKADARLIAAAPDLLAACKLYVEYATGHKSDELLTADEKRRMAEVHRGYSGPVIVERMQAAIAKAEAL